MPVDLSQQAARQVVESAREWISRHGITAANKASVLEQEALEAARAAARKGEDVLAAARNALLSKADELQIRPPKKGIPSTAARILPGEPPIDFRFFTLSEARLGPRGTITLEGYTNPSTYQTIQFDGKGTFSVTERSFMQPNPQTRALTRQEMVSLLNRLQSIEDSAPAKQRQAIEELRRQLVAHTPVPEPKVPIKPPIPPQEIAPFGTWILDYARKSGDRITVKMHNPPVPDLSSSVTITYDGKGGFFEAEKNFFLGGARDVRRHALSDAEKTYLLEQLVEMEKSAAGKQKATIQELIKALRQDLLLQR